jgi:hypothetical protein
MSHPLSREQLQACRAYERLLAARTEGWDEMEACDRHWDGGEWSGPAWGDNWQRAEEYCERVIAERFELGTGESVMQMMWCYWNEQEYYEIQAMTGRNERPLPPDPWGESIGELV